MRTVSYRYPMMVLVLVHPYWPGSHIQSNFRVTCQGQSPWKPTDSGLWPVIGVFLFWFDVSAEIIVTLFYLAVLFAWSWITCSLITFWYSPHQQTIFSVSIHCIVILFLGIILDTLLCKQQCCCVSRICGLWKNLSILHSRRRKEFSLRCSMLWRHCKARCFSF